MKTANKTKLRDRLDAALCNLYHNATPGCVSLDSEQAQEAFQNWFSFAASCEIEYIQDGLGRTAQDWLKESKTGFQANERYFWLVSRITDYGKLYQYGRGGRTLAPSQLVSRSGRPIQEQDINLADATDMVMVLEAFNNYVEDWNKSENLAAMWKEEIIQTCPGCAEHPTEALWQTPLELMCDDCSKILA